MVAPNISTISRGGNRAKSGIEGAFSKAGAAGTTSGFSRSGDKDTTSSSHCSGWHKAASELASCWKLTNTDRRAASAGAAV